VTVIFSQLFGRDYGLINWFLHFFGIHNIWWQADKLHSHLAIASMVIWRWTGYNALIYLAAMQVIPHEMYESATLDGASNAQQFRHITIPLIRPTIIFTAILSTIGGLQLFAEPLLFDPQYATGTITGGSDRQFQTLVMYIYERGFNGSSGGNYGYGSAIAWVLFLVIVLVVALNYALVRRIRSTD